MRLRTPALILHRWIGLLVSLLLIIISLTGSLLIFSDELDRAFNPQLLHVEPQGEMQSHQELVESAKKLYPALKVHRITVPSSPDVAYTVMMADAKDDYTDVYLNPFNGEVLGSRPWKQTIGGFLIELHVHLLAGDFGMQIVGICGGLLLLMGITGLALWNGWRNLKYGLTIRWQAPRQLVHYDVHKAIGVLSVAFLALIAATGMAMVFWTPFENAVYHLTQNPRPVEVASQVAVGKAPMAINEILQKAEAALPGAKLFKFFPAKKPEATFNVWMHFPQEHEFNKEPYLHLDQYTGAVLRVDNPKQASLATRIMTAQYILHVGNYGGWFTRILYCLVGFAPLALVVTGFALWQRRRWLAAHRREAMQHSQRVTAKP